MRKPSLLLFAILLTSSLFVSCKSDDSPLQGELIIESSSQYMIANGIATIDIKLYDRLEDRTKTLVNGEILLNGQSYANTSLIRFSTEEARDHVFTAKVGNIEEELIIHARAPQNYDTLYVPIIFHLIKDQRGTWARQSLETAGWLQNLLDEANAKLNPDNERLNSTFDNYNWHSANIKLVAATHDPQGNLLDTPGLNIYEDLSQELKLNKNADWVWDVYWPPSKYMNAWVGDIDISNAAGRGYTPFFPISVKALPGTTNIPTTTQPNHITGIELEIVNPLVLLHELGHYLALGHVFSIRCTTQGDYCDDTFGYIKNDLTVPEHIERFSCSQKEFISNNIMDYGHRQLLFTLDQVKRMRYSLEFATYRPFNKSATGGEANLGGIGSTVRITKPEKIIHAHGEY